MAILESGPLLVIAIVVLLFFGATQIPRLARAFGRAQGEFKKAKAEFTTEAGKGEAEALRASPDEAAVRKSARDLGIDESGRSVDEVKRLMQEKLA